MRGIDCAAYSCNLIVPHLPKPAQVRCDHATRDGLRQP